MQNSHFEKNRQSNMIFQKQTRALQQQQSSSAAFNQQTQANFAQGVNGYSRNNGEFSLPI